MRKTVPNNNFSKNILTVGDSFAFGWEVSDQETWQSCLNRELTHLNFLNGGNGSYGTAQAILRAKRLYKEIKPSSLLVQTLVGHNFYRDQLIRKQGLPKPYLLKDQKGEIKVIYPNFKIEKDFSYQKKQIPNFIDYLIVNTSLLKRFSNDSLAYKVWNNSYSKFTPNSNKFGNNHASIEEIINWTVNESKKLDSSVIWLLQYTSRPNRRNLREREILISTLKEKKINFIDTFDYFYGELKSPFSTAELWNPHHTKLGNEIVCKAIINSGYFK